MYIPYRCPTIIVFQVICKLFCNLICICNICSCYVFDTNLEIEFLRFKISLCYCNCCSSACLVIFLIYRIIIIKHNIDNRRIVINVYLLRIFVHNILSCICVDYVNVMNPIITDSLASFPFTRLIILCPCQC